MWSRRLSSAALVLAVVGCKSARNTETAHLSDTTTTSMRPGDSSAGARSTNAMNAPAGQASTGDAKIDEAMSAGPASVTKNATIMDWPDSAGGKPKELRAGTNGWTCFPSTPKTVGESGNDPMCLDKEFLAWGQALAEHKPPHVKGMGLAYMLRGDHGASNTDPYAAKATDDNHWVTSGPHLMVLAPNTAQLATLPTDPNNGGPWVMWKGTPYAHIMAPTGDQVATSR